MARDNRTWCRRGTACLVAGLVAATVGGAAWSASSAASPRPAAVSGSITVHPTPDRTSVIKNPAMGWQLYVESASGKFPDAATFWREVDPYRAVASELYIRMPWSAFEPTEGHYAWRTDPNFRALIRGARDRGLRLAFRVIVDSQSTGSAATPQWVFDDGAAPAPIRSDTGFPDPVLTDPVFRARFGNFIHAFAARFDDPRITDFVDTTGLGWWGEGAHTQLASADLGPTLRWATGLYAREFRHVLLTLNYGGGDFPIPDQEAALSGGLAIRRDSLGSRTYFPTADQDAIKAHFPTTAVFGENCYQDFVLRATTSCDGAIHTDGIRAVLQRVVQDALNIHANTLDLRWPATDVPTWVRDHPDLVRQFAVSGGYRLAPDSVNFPSVFTGRRTRIRSHWGNAGVGILPNEQHGWDGKYRVAYALLDHRTGRPVYRTVSRADPGTWVKGRAYPADAPFAPHVRPGTYDFATAIVDGDSDRSPTLHLAVRRARHRGWTILGQTTVLPTRR